MRGGFGSIADAGAKSILERAGVVANVNRSFPNQVFTGGFEHVSDHWDSQSFFTYLTREHLAPYHLACPPHRHRANPRLVAPRLLLPFTGPSSTLARPIPHKLHPITSFPSIPSHINRLLIPPLLNFSLPTASPTFHRIPCLIHLPLREVQSRQCITKS